MASEEQKAVVAPSEKMPFKRIEVDPGGDTLIILPQRGGALREKPLFTTESKPLFITESKPLFITESKPMFITESKPLFTTESKPDDSGTLPEIHYLVSKKHLALASRRAQKMFAGDYKEAVPNNTDGLHHWKFDPIFDPTAFEILMIWNVKMPSGSLPKAGLTC
ncbi:hypothetical protein CFIMG_002050RA [Ceratocystis fimbriata CBS 114723]|uniref:Uncharacterized protein n=1 Tax=Ceratocystis fimbriata CBS 114723 TaxID=1035309 RepID=A0A2C5X6A1_9PEZI|nr:hypothetical protein CFIMG_002050RA [Ceratocystis fimbriata CBS 114723]